MGASKLELLYFALFLLPGFSLIGISYLEFDLLKSILNAFVGILSLLVALVVLWRWAIFQIKIQSSGLFIRQLSWNSRVFRPVVRTFFLPYEEMRLVFYLRGQGQKPNIFGIVLKDYKGTDLSSEMNELNSRDAPSLYQEAVMDDGTSHRVFTTRILGEKQIKILTADLIWRVPKLKLEDNLRNLMGLEQPGVNYRKGYGLGLIIALIPVSVMSVVLFILKFLNKS